MIAFTPTGPLLAITASTTAPTSVQAVSLDNVNNQQVMITNTDATINAVIGWGPSDAVAKSNAAAPAYTPNCTYVLHGTQLVVTIPPNSYISGITATSTAAIKVQAGYGKL